MIKQLAKRYNPSEVEKRISEFWSNTNAYEKTKQHRATGRDYYFVDGPPYTTGSIHLGTAWNKIIKDVVLRYKRMKGYNVCDQPGFDMHGLPIEVLVEQSMKIKNKKEIESRGIANFVNACREFAIKFQNKMSEEFAALGVWLDWTNPSLSISPHYIESAWWTIKRAYERNLLKQDRRVQYWCPRCETVLAESEIEYWDETDPSIYVKLPIKDRKDEYILIWTTTPWTLPANLAVAVHPDLEYVKLLVKKGGKEFQLYTLRETHEIIVNAIIPERYEVLQTLTGNELVGLEYDYPLLEEVPYQKELKGEWLHKVVSSKLVAPENTGIVHIAPGHGQEDFEIGVEYKLPPVCPVTENGTFSTKINLKYSSLSVKAANAYIINDLKSKNYILYDELTVHRYGHCWRCKTPIIYRPTEQWFLKVTELKPQLLDAVASIKWIPEWVGSRRMHEWITNARDWCISRQRYWGIPLPIWKCRCGSLKVVGSVAELKEARNYDENIDLHRPWIDELVFDCKNCNGEMRRVPDVLDVWFDAGICSWAQLQYPMVEEKFKRLWPSEWITEGYEQTRGWFYSQLVAGVVAFNKSPYNSVLSHGLIVDESGQKLSKSSGFAQHPLEVAARYGADALRLYLMGTNAPWEDLMFAEEGVRIANKTLNVLWNVCIFATTYMILDKFSTSAVDLKSVSAYFRTEDKWLLSKIESLKKLYNNAFAEMAPHKAVRAVEHFILEDLSRWYVKLVRDRTWLEGESGDKLAVYYTLHQAISNSILLLAPFTPFIAEELYQKIDGTSPTVHMLDMPVINESFLDANLEISMDIVREIVETVSSARQKAKLKLRRPLKTVVVRAENDEVVNAVRIFTKVLQNQTNCFELVLLEPKAEWAGAALSAEPNFAEIRKVYRDWTTKISLMLTQRPATEIKKEFEKKGEYVVVIQGQYVKIFPNMVEFKTAVPENMVMEKFKGGSVYIDLTLAPEIEARWYAKELVRRIQAMRKDLNIEVEDYIETFMSCSDRIKELLRTHNQFDYISVETRSKKLEFVSEQPVKGKLIKDWELSDKPEDSVTIGVQPIASKKKPPEELPAAPTPPPAPKPPSLHRPPTKRIEFEKVKPIERLETIEELERIEKKEIKLEPSFTYLIKSDKPVKAYEHFQAGLKDNFVGFCITRDHPEKVRSKYSLPADLHIVWLSTVPVADAIRPKDLEKLSLQIEHFAGRYEKTIIILDCIEYLITNNPFTTVLRFIQSLRDLVAIRKAILIIQLNPAALEPQQLSLLESEVDVTV